jgi:integrase
MTTDLSRVGTREALTPKANRTPHWDRLQPRLHLGYSPTRDGVAGAWTAKANVGGKLLQETLGAFAELPANERFAKAKAAAEAFLARMESGGAVLSVVDTVADACRAYVADDHASAEVFFRRNVYNHPLGAIRLRNLTHQDLADWRKQLAARPLARGQVQSKTHHKAEVHRLHAAGVKPAQIAKQLGIGRASAYRLIAAPAAKASPKQLRKASSLNREMTPLRAALYAKLPPGPPSKVTPPWQDALAKIERAKTHQPRERTLDRRERKLVLDHASDEIRPFVRALTLLPVRVGALAKATKADFNERTGVLNIRVDTDKGHPARVVPLSPAAIALFKEQARSKHPAAPLFARANGKAWSAQSWQDPIRDAVAAAGLEPGATAYTFRHSVITDLVADGTDILTVAKVAGTSVKEIEETYGHMKDNVARDALQSLAL